MGAAVGDFFQLAVGGLGWGTLCALVVLFWLWLSIWAPRAEVMVVIMATFATYFFGEHSLHVSGVLATVAFGVMYAYVVKFFMSIKAQEMSHELWEEVGYLANTIIFVIAGILIYNEAFERENPLGFQVHFALVLLLVVLLMAFALLLPRLTACCLVMLRLCTVAKLALPPLHIHRHPCCARCGAAHHVCKEHNTHTHTCF